MKNLVKILGMIIMMNVAVMTIPRNACAQTSVSFQVFYDDLSPYGSWVNYPAYGYVWIPDYGAGFAPYSSNGYWVYTEYGWTWFSYYPWGWAPFHYGRWTYDSYYGWFWIPDNVWGPAWVCWRTGPGYYGWAPLGPNISFSFVIGGGYNPPVNYWIFTNYQYMGRNDIYNYYGPRTNNTTYINNSTVITNTHIDNKNQVSYLTGPKKEDVEKAGGIKVKPLSVKESNKPGSSVRNNELTIYKPEVAKDKDENLKPAKVVDLKEVKPVSERKTPKQPQKNTGVKKNDPVSLPAGKTGKKTEPKEMKKQSVPEKEKQLKQVPKPVEPKMNEQKKSVPQPYKEPKKQEQPLKIIQPKTNEPKNPPLQPYREMKKPVQPPPMNQPKMNQPKNPVPQSQPKSRKPH